MSNPTPHLRATSTLHSRSTSFETMDPDSSNTGTVSLKLATSEIRFVGTTAWSWLRCSTYSAIPPSNWNSSFTPVRLSSALSFSPGTKNAVWFSLPFRSSRENAADDSNIWWSGQ